jgi:hypothetical protein
LLIVAVESLFVAPSTGSCERSCISFQHFLLKFVARLDRQKIASRNVRQKLIAKSRNMTGFDEWMCMPARGTRLAPLRLAAARPTMLSEE